MQVGISRTKQLIMQLTLWLLHFLLFISNSCDTNQTQIWTRKVKAMTSGLLFYDRVANAAKHQASDASNHEVNAIGRCKMDSRVDTCCAEKMEAVIVNRPNV